MAAYAAVISLKHTTNGLLNPSQLSPVFSSSTLELLEFVYNETTSLQQVLERLNGSSKRLDGLEGQLRDAAHKLEDVLELYELKSEEKHKEEEVLQEITSFAETVKKLEKDYIEELSSPVTEEDNDVDESIVDFGVDMVGHSTLFNDIRDDLRSKMRPIDSYSFSFLGEIGSGRTLTANTSFEAVQQFYECCAWVTLGTKTYENFKEVVIRIVEQVDNDEVAEGESFLWEEDEKMISDYLYKTLEHRRYLIVLDDVR